jgi:elongation factor G
MYGLAIEAKSRNDEQKLSTAIHKLMEEDPTLVVERVSATKQTVARGLGELHLRIALEKMKDRYHAEVVTEPPRVAYKETIAGKAEGHHRHKKQTGGAGQFGEVYLRVEPMQNGSTEPYEFVNETVGGSIPRQFMPAIEKGIRQVLETGAIAGYPLFGVRVAVYDGKHHPVDSKEVAFTTAGKKAFIDAVQKAKPVILEPFVHMEVTAPASHLGDLTADISGKRGRVSATDVLPGDMCLVKAEAPLSEVMNFTSELKSITGGAGSFTMEYSHDEKAPPNVQAEVVAAYKPHEDDED